MQPPYRAPKLLRLCLACLGLLVVWGGTGPSWAQNRTAKGVGRLQLAAGANMLAYRGDLNQGNGALERFHAGGAFQLQFDSQRRVYPVLDLGFGRITAQNRELGPVDGIQPNTFVRFRYFFADVRVLVQFRKNKRLRPVAGLGLGILNFSPVDQNGLDLTLATETRAPNETYGTTVGLFPFTAGVRYQLNKSVWLGLDYTLLLTGSDYLDNISQLGSTPGGDFLHGLQFLVRVTLPDFKGRQVGGKGDLLLQPRRKR